MCRVAHNSTNTWREVKKSLSLQVSRGEQDNRGGEKKKKGKRKKKGKCLEVSGGEQK